VLALLVAVSLILLTAYFGESPSSPLHSVQRGIVEVLSPIQEGASKALTPVRDVAGWFSSTIHAKSQRDQLRKQVAQLQTKLGLAQAKAIQYDELSKQLALDNSIGIDTYKPVSAYVIQRDPNLWYSTVQVDKGSSDGVRVDDPVLADGALVGKVSTVAPTVSVVTLLTDHTYAVTAEVQETTPSGATTGDTGVLVPAVGNPSQMLLQFLPPSAPIAANQMVVTAGFKSNGLDSLYPPGIPIGTISSSFSQNGLINNRQAPVTPAADLRHFDTVQILTKPRATNQRAQVP
jgi:rod shape-determining protein MreC